MSAIREYQTFTADPYPIAGHSALCSDVQHNLTDVGTLQELQVTATNVLGSLSRPMTSPGATSPTRPFRKPYFVSRTL